ncbi:MAG TPA: hypothetical protein VHB77_10775 [Planctomycetaceae bacterium]|nr:hypothetical protein [Planctomycetaceae bacterium]
MQWLTEEFDDTAFSGRRIVLPTEQFFPDPYDGSEESVRAMLDRVCGYMDVVPELVDMELVSRASVSNSLGLVNDAGQALGVEVGNYQERYGRFLIRIDSSQVGNSFELVGTMAHELAHLRLLGEGRIMSEIYDNELLTDLTTVVFGLGIFRASGTQHWRSNFNSYWPGTTIKKPEYMTGPMYGYALAHLAWFRGEEKPAWGKHLHLNARPDLRHGIKYLFKTRDSSFRPARWQ